MTTITRARGLLVLFRQFATTPAVLGIARSYGLNGLTVLLNFAFITLCAWVLGAHDFGVFSILFSAAGLSAVITTFGQQSILLRSWHEYAAARDLARLKGALIFAVAAFAVTGAVTGAVFIGGVALVYGGSLALLGGLYMLLLAFGNITTHLARTSIGVEMGDGVEGTVAISVPLAYLAVCLLRGEQGDLATVFACYAAGFALAIAIQAVAIYRTIRRRFPDFFGVAPVFNRAMWTQRSLRLWISSAIEACSQYLDVILFGVLMDPMSAGAYFVITRLANINATAAGAMHMFSTRHLPDLYYSRNEAGMSRMLDTIAHVTLLVIGASTVTLLAAGYWLLQMFNPVYVEHYPAMAILTLATAAVAMIGPSAAVLMFTGHERNVVHITVVTLVVRLAALLVLVPLFSLDGAVIAIVCSFLVMTVMTRNAAFRLTGLDCSVIRLLNREAVAS